MASFVLKGCFGPSTVACRRGRWQHIACVLRTASAMLAFTLAWSWGNASYPNFALCYARCVCCVVLRCAVLCCAVPCWLQLLCMMFKLQLIMLTWDRKEAEQAVAAAAALLKQLEQPGGSTAPSFVAMLKLQFTVLQVGLQKAGGCS